MYVNKTKRVLSIETMLKRLVFSISKVLRVSIPVINTVVVQSENELVVKEAQMYLKLRQFA